MPSRPDAPASYAIPVRRARTLPAASFRFRVTPDTLAVRLTVPVIRVRRGLAPPSHESATTADSMVLAHHAPCRAHIIKSPPTSLVGFLLWWISSETIYINASCINPVSLWQCPCPTCQACDLS